MKTISTQTEIQSQPNPLTNSASTCSKRCSLPCSWPIVISAAVIFLLYLLYCPHKTTGQKKRIFAKRKPSHIFACEPFCDLFKSANYFAKRRFSHTVSCETVCETNRIVSLRTKSHLTHFCDATRIAKGIPNSNPMWLDRNESLQKKIGGEGGYLQMLLWGRECHLALACGWNQFHSLCCLKELQWWITDLVHHGLAFGKL